MVSLLWQRFARQLRERWGAAARPRKRPNPSRPTLVALEERLAPAVVSNLLDAIPAPPGSLRAACTGGGAVTFAPGLSGVIHLAPGAPEILFPPGITTVAGNGAITVNGRNETRIFHVPPAATVTIDNLTLTDGFARLSTPVAPFAGMGGAVLDEGTLTADSDFFSYNRAFVNGGAIETTSGSNAALTVSLCTFTGNRAITGFGGALSTNDGMRQGSNLNAFVFGSAFLGNEAARGGGAIDCDPPAVTFGSFRAEVDYCYFQGNEATDGGGLYSADTAMAGVEVIYLGGDSFDSNGANGALTAAGASGFGGAVDLSMSLSGTAQAYGYIAGGDFVNGATTGFTGNWANYGGAISTIAQTAGNSLASVQIEQVEVSSNQAVWGGGIYQDTNGGSVDPTGGPGYRTSITLTHSTVDDNVATSLPVGTAAIDGKGGGIYANATGNRFTLLDYVNDTVAYNGAVTSSAAPSVGNGGGIYLAATNSNLVPLVSLNSLTVAYNAAVNNGGGLYVENPAGAIFFRPTMRNCAFCFNTAAGSGQDGFATVTSTGYNVVSSPPFFNGLGGTDILGVPCALDTALAANGGPTLTLWPLAVVPSPLRGTSYVLPGTQFDDPPDDQRYVARISPTSRGAVDPGHSVLPPAPPGGDAPPRDTNPADAGLVAALTSLRRDRPFAPADAE